MVLAMAVLQMALTIAVLQLTFNEQPCNASSYSVDSSFSTTGLFFKANNTNSSPSQLSNDDIFSSSIRHALPTMNATNLALAKKYPFTLVNCAGKKTSVYMHSTVIIDWVCKDGGEKKVTSVMMHVFRSYKAKKDAAAAGVSSGDLDTNMMMLDVGANAGYYGLLAGSFSIPTVLFDLQPECVEIIQSSIVKNNLQNNLRVVPMGVSEEEEQQQQQAEATTMVHAVEGGNKNGGAVRTGGEDNNNNNDNDNNNNDDANAKKPASSKKKKNTIAVPMSGCNGRFPFADSEVVNARHPKRIVDVEMGVLGRYVTNPTTNILMMKVDTEGNEKRVLQGAMDFFQSKRIKNAIIEVTPGHGFWAKAGIQRQEVAETFQTIINDCDYAMVSLADYRVFRDGKAATNYILGNKSPGQFDVWLMPSEKLASTLQEYQRSLEAVGATAHFSFS